MVEQQVGASAFPAPEWNIQAWIGADGETLDKPVTLADYAGKIVVMLAFQSWCPGCHSSGFPTIQFLKQEFESNPDVKFLAVQTVFEGHNANTFDKLLENQRKYQLDIPFGHDIGTSVSNNYPHIMLNYRTGGTPWIIVIDSEGMVRYSDFHIDPQRGVELIKELASKI